MTKEIFSPATLPPPVGYSHIAKVNKGTLVYVAGQVSTDASGKLVGEGNFEAQAEQVFANVKIAVEAAGGTSVHEQIPASCVGFWDRWKGMM